MSGRSSRSALLVAAVALSAALITAVSCSMASLHRGVRQRVESTVGAADLRVQRIGKDVFSADLMARVEAWPEVTLAVGRLGGPISLSNPRTGKDFTTVGNGVMPDRELRVRPQTLLEGRFVEKDGEVALQEQAAVELGARVGDLLDVDRWGEPVKLTVVGIVKNPPLSELIPPESWVPLETMGRITEKPGSLRDIDVVIRDSSRAEGLAAEKAPEFDKGVVLRPASKVTSGLAKNMQSSQIGMAIASMLSFLAASFIIMTGLSTNVTERQRELAMLRCIGAMRWQLAESQLIGGLVIGLVGSLFGLPLGIIGAYVLTRLFPDQLPVFAINWLGLAFALGGSMFAGLLGAAWPAIRASRTTPLEALTIRSRPASVRGIVLCGVIGVLCAAAHAGIFLTSAPADVKFWADMVFGIPAAFTGYFLISVPVTVVAASLLAALISRVFRLPGEVLRRTILATPYRFGFTAGAMMMGLALLVALWTNGRSVTRDWLGTLSFPDAFVTGISMSEKTLDRIKSMPQVKDSCAVTIQNFKTEAFGLKAFDNVNTSFVAFEPAPFFRMTKMTWVEGDERTALERLERGGAVIVAQEYKVAKGIGVGDKVTLYSGGKPYVFDVVGVVNSPGLDIASKFFDIGEEYLDQAVNAVFGSRDDLKRMFGNSAINLIQMSFQPEVTDQEAVLRQIRRAAGFEIVSAGSGKAVKAEIAQVLHTSFLVMSVVAVGAMLVASFGVANLIVAGIQARQFEFGVLRAIGAERGLISRLVLGEAAVVAAAACVVGTIFGIQAAWAGQRMNEAMIGLKLSLAVPVGPTLAGWAMTALITLGSAGPAVWALSRKHPRELLGVVRG
ncbi:MAG: FtsX-like permease family protein [Phycisphaerales bacterium]